MSDMIRKKVSKNALRQHDNEKKGEKWWLRPSMVHCLRSCPFSYNKIEFYF